MNTNLNAYVVLVMNGKYKNGHLFCRQIRFDIPMMPEYLSAATKDFIMKMLEENPKKRLDARKRGVHDIKEHPFFDVSSLSISAIIQ